MRRAIQVRQIGPPRSRGIPVDPTRGRGTSPSSTLEGWQAKKALVTVPSSSSEARPSPNSFDFAKVPVHSRVRNRGADEATTAPGNQSSLAGVVSLRCMYTNQKTKKRKVWSDGAVKCCPKRLRVSLYRWSEVLGVTEKLLGEIYLSVPEYDAFVTLGEPELEMEEYIVSLDGVIQQCDGTNPRDSDKSNVEGSIGDNGRKRKLLKPFKPPTRRAPPVSSATLSGESSRLTGRVYQQRETPARGNHGGMLPERASFTGFGHVESLWETDEQDEQNTWSPAPNRDCWVDSKGGEGGVHDDSYVRPEFRSEGTDEGAGEIHPLVTGSESRMSDYLWNQEDRPSTLTTLPPTQGFSGGLQPASRANVTPDHAGLFRTDHTHRLRNTESNGSGIARREHSRNLEDSANCPASSETIVFADEENGAYGSAEVGSQRRFLELLDCCPSGGDKIEHQADLECVPDVRDAHGPGGKDERQVRSTQDILSLFGGFGALDQPLNGKIDGESNRPGSHRSDMNPASKKPDIGGSMHAVHPTGIIAPSGGGSHAIEMRRAQKAARTAGPTHAGASESAGAVNAVGDWSCEVCGVRGSPASTACRVCGAARPASPGSDIENRVVTAEGVNVYDYDASCSDGRLNATVMNGWEQGTDGCETEFS